MPTSHYKQIGLGLFKMHKGVFFPGLLIWLVLYFVCAIPVMLNPNSIMLSYISAIVLFIFDMGFILGFVHAINKAYYSHNPELGDILYCTRNMGSFGKVLGVGAIAYIISFIVLFVAIFVLTVVFMIAALAIFGGMFAGGSMGSLTGGMVFTIILACILILALSLLYSVLLGTYMLSAIFSVLRNPSIKFGDLLSKTFKVFKKHLGGFTKICIGFIGWYILAMVVVCVVAFAVGFFIAFSAGGNIDPTSSALMAPMYISIFVAMIPFLPLAAYFLCTVSAYFNQNMDQMESTQNTFPV